MLGRVRDGILGVCAQLCTASRDMFAPAQSDHRGALPQLYAATVPDVRGKSYAGPGFEVTGCPRRALRPHSPIDYADCGSSASS